MDQVLQGAVGETGEGTSNSPPLPEALLRAVLQVGTKVTLKPGARVSRPESATDEHFYFVLEGHLIAVVEPSAERSEAAADAASRPRSEFVTYFTRGDFFSDGYLTAPERALGPRVDCVAETRAELGAISRADLAGLMAANPGWSSLLEHRNAALRLHFLRHRLPEGRIVQDFFLRHHYLNAAKIRVVKLDSCIECNACVSACANRHHGFGQATRTGPKLGRIAFPSGCAACVDATCLAVCKAGALHRNPVTHQIGVDDRCTGCGACAKVCPRNAVTMCDVPYTVENFPHPIPASDGLGNTSVDGLFVIGDAATGKKTKSSHLKAASGCVTRTAMRLSAMRGGAHTVGVRREAQWFDVIVVGAGAAGLSAAQECLAHSLGCAVIDRAAFVSGRPGSAGLTVRWSKLATASTMALFEDELVTRIQPSSAGGGFDVVTTKRVLHTCSVIVATGAGEGLDLLQQAGVEILQPGSAEMAAHAARLGTRRQATKCDGCEGFDDEACLVACPTGSLVELRPIELFFENETAGSELRPDFSAVPFVQGIDEHRRRRTHRFPWLGIFTLVVSAVAGIECFLRRTMPETSLTARWGHWHGTTNATEFVSSRGLGHGLGYLGTAFMLMTLLYSLRSRLGWFSFVSKQTFLSCHIWLGIAGASFVSYHSLFKLDRWAALALWATWLVILSGIVGRYVYGWVHSQLGVTESELKAVALQQNDLGFALPGGADGMPPRVWPALDQDVEGAGEQKVRRNVFIGLIAMVWLDARDRIRLWRLRLFGTRHIEDRALRRQVVRLLGERARAARRKRYWDEAHRLLTWWNHVHIVVALLMLVLAGVHVVYSIVYTGY